MTLRTRLFLFFGALIALLASAELWLVRSLAQDLEAEAQGLAMKVGATFVQAFSGAVPLPGTLESSELGFGIHSVQGEKRTIHPPAHLESAWQPQDLPEILSLLRAQAQGSKADPLPQNRELRDPINKRVFALRIEAQGDEASSGLAGLAQELVLRLTEDVHAPSEEAMVTVPLERPGLRKATERFRSRLILGSAAILGLGLLVAGLVAHRVSEPLRQLSQAAQAVGEGAFGVQVPPTGDEEVRGTLQAFNTMSLRLAELDAEADRLREGKHLSELGDIARGLAHSLRNPLHVLGLSVDKLAAGAEPGLGEAARAHIERIDRTLRSLLVLSSSGAEEIVTVDLVDVARDVALELLQDPSRSHPTRVEAAARAVVRGVPAELRAVVHVLMVNAAEASPEGAPIEVHVRPHAGGVELTVSDEGPGLDPKVRATLFQPHTTSKPQGAGMGLYLAQRIVSSRYGGTLSLEERPSGGTQACLRLQARTVAA